MDRAEYQEYLASPGWLRRRAEVIRLARWRCQRCRWNIYAREGRWLEVHHLCYDRLGDELAGDVEVLCNVCHAEAHNQPVHPQPSILWRVMAALNNGLSFPWKGRS